MQTKYKMSGKKEKRQRSPYGRSVKSALSCAENQFSFLKLSHFQQSFPHKTVETVRKSVRFTHNKSNNPLFNRVFHRMCGKAKGILSVFPHEIPQIGDFYAMGIGGKYFPQRSIFFFDGSRLRHDCGKLVHHFFGEFGSAVKIINTVLLLFHVVKLRIAKTANFGRMDQYVCQARIAFHLS